MLYILYCLIQFFILKVLYIENTEKTIVIIDDHYFDVTEYIDSHPGGKRILKKFHLKDATDEFNSI